MSEKTFKNIDNILHKDAGCSVYIENLRYLDELKKTILQKSFTGQLTANN